MAERRGRAPEKEKKEEQDRRGNRILLRRIWTLLIVFGVLAFLPLIRKLYQIQIVEHDRYEQLAIEQQTRDVAVEAERGTITDANGSVLAMSTTVYKIIVSPRDLVLVQENYAKKVESAKGNPKKMPTTPEPTNALVAEGLAEILSLDAEKVAGRLERTYSAYEVLVSQAEEETADAVRTFIRENGLSNSIVITPTSKRYYPYNELACQVIGFVNSNGGAYGMEALYDEELSGTVGRIVTARSGRGTEMLSSYENYYDASNGDVVQLTIDKTIQHCCERILAKGIDTFDVRDGGFAIAMDPKTGAIKGWANSPNYDLNHPNLVFDDVTAAALEELKELCGGDGEEYLKALADAQNYQWRNKAINDTYEPGSTFKTVVLAAALEEGVVKESDHFYCGGSVEVAGYTIHCSRRSGHGDQTLAQAVGNSCNPAFIAIGQRLGAERFYNYLENFGFTQLTGIDMQGEANSIIWTRDYFTSAEGIASLATASFGQRLKVTPIQLITAASAVVNGGHLMQPYVMQSVTDETGTVVASHEPTEVRQVVSESTSATARAILEKVVDGGTGKNAYQAGYRIGGKTGSSETGEADHTIVSFLAFAPADDPQIIVLLAYDNPKPVSHNSNYTADGWYISGGQMAAPMAGELVADILDYMGVEKQYTQSELSGADTAVPGVIGRTAQDAKTRLEAAGFTVRTVGTGASVTDQIPVGGAAIPGGSEIVLYLGEEKPTDKVTVPDVLGMSPSRALAALREAGLYLRAKGSTGYYTSSTTAVSQSIAADTEVERGTVVDVRFMNSENEGAGWGF